jgi:hypothetical protein
MKRILLASLIAVIVLAPAAAKSPKAAKAPKAAESPAAAKAPAAEPGPFSIDFTTGAYFDARDLTGGILDILVAIYDLRAGFTVDFEYAFSKAFNAGGEVGVMYFPGDDTMTIQIFDIPIRAKMSLRGGAFTADFFGGVFYYCLATTTFDVSAYLDAGLRLTLWRVFLEGSYELPFDFDFDDGFFRFGLGMSLPLRK